MCEYCEKEKEKYPNDKYGPICPREAGRSTGRIINKVLSGEELTELEKKLFDAFDKLAQPTFYGVPLQNIPKGGIDDMITTRFGKRGEGKEAEKAFDAAYTRCPICLERVTRMTPAFCPKCKARETEQIAKERYFGMPAKEWDGKTPLYSYVVGQYFMCLGDLEDHIKEYVYSKPPSWQGTIEGLRLVICEPVYLQMLGDHYWEDDLPTDGNRELPTGVARAVEALNKIIGEQGPVSWVPGKYRVEGEILPMEKP